jgi:hypothetical protein
MVIDQDLSQPPGTGFPPATGVPGGIKFEDIKFEGEAEFKPPVIQQLNIPFVNAFFAPEIGEYALDLPGVDLASQRGQALAQAFQAEQAYFVTKLDFIMNAIKQNFPETDLSDYNPTQATIYTLLKPIWTLGQQGEVYSYDELLNPVKVETKVNTSSLPSIFGEDPFKQEGQSNTYTNIVEDVKQGLNKFYDTLTGSGRPVFSNTQYDEAADLLSNKASMKFEKYPTTFESKMF